MSASVLKLYGRSAEDMHIISAYLQDALAQLGDMAHLADEKRFIVLFNRFCWEREARRCECVARCSLLMWSP